MDAAALLGVASRTAECAALVLIGYQLRAAQLFSATDAQAAQRLAGYLTLPAVILHSCNTLPPLPWPALIGGGVVLLSSAASAAFTWHFFRGRHKRERAVLASCALGSDAASVALPLAEALCGPAGVVAGCAALAANVLSVCGGSYLLAGSAGPAFPQAYEHEDGGSYRGEWRGLSKEGLGVYTYPSGARYEGEWRDNLKAGRGVYYFPKGGTYEGEWAAGSMSGTGLRTYTSGRVAAGRWEGGVLVAPLELWQCANAAEGAAEAALAARRVVVGGGAPADAGQLLLAQPALWAALAGLALNAASVPLPGSLAAIAGALAPANRPLMLLAAGMLLAPVVPQARQLRDVAAVCAARVACALFVTANALVLLPRLLPPAAGAAADVALLSPAASSSGAAAAALAALDCGLLSVLVAGLVLLSPLPGAALDFTRSFRLNESLAAACRDGSLVAAAPLLLLLVGGAGGLGLLPADVLPLASSSAPPPPLVAAAAAAAAAAVGQGAGEAAAAAVEAAATALAAGMMVVAAGVAVGAGALWERLSPDRGRLLTYAGAGPAAAAAAAAEEPGLGGSDAAAAAAPEQQPGGGSSTSASALPAARGCATSWPAPLQRWAGRQLQPPPPRLHHLRGRAGVCRVRVISSGPRIAAVKPVKVLT